MPRKERYVDWSSVSIPQVYMEQIASYLKHTRKISSISEFMRRFMDAKLKEYLEDVGKRK